MCSHFLKRVISSLSGAKKHAKDTITIWRDANDYLRSGRASLFCKFSSTDISRAIELLDKLQKTGEVPPQKLQALQRVLQSEFCNAVREVNVPASHLCILMPL